MVPEGPESIDRVGGGCVDGEGCSWPGSGPGFRLRRSALTSKVWGPSVSAGRRSSGLEQAAKALGVDPALESWWRPGSEENTKLGGRIADGAGGAGVDCGVGGVVSTVKDLVAGVGSWFPAASSALKVAVWGPSERPVKDFGEVQSVKGSVSIRHWILAVSPGLAELNRKVASSVAMVPEGPESMTVSGAVVSTVKDLVAGVGSWFPAASSALKVAVWGPSERPVKDFGEVQSVKGSVSIRHWILAVSPGLAELNRKVASSVAMVPEGPESMTVSGAVVSTVKVRVAGVGSWFAGCVGRL